ncbi:adaptin N terminal region domain containing protein [Babesia ovis]|uniref:Adaptin N terminal region domain containing protein n=1 Tax=Babesia ovis TaxID=5869 RepID=A0A9W5TC15_BABOV|nr:adaptin N terminal region domain containing protein [Babesia ovis]
MLSLTAPHLSREFYRFTKALGEARSKDEEERVVLGEITALKRLFLAKDVDRERLKEYLVRAVYVEMLGFEAPFAHIHAINMAQERNLVCKRAGYWACRQLLKPQSELMLLLINTIQKDLQSPHFMDISCALQSVCDLVNRDMVPTILPCVLRCLDSENEHVRKHAIMAIRSFYEFDATCVENITGIIEKGICDPRPSVMGCTLSLLQDVISSKPRSCRHLVPSLVSILNQIIDRRLNRSYDYHRVPAPWIQISIISIFGRMGRDDRRVSEQIYGCLQNVLQQAESYTHQSGVISNAIIFECIKTIAAITPRESLTTMCSISVSRMLTSENNNLRYAGISGLSTLVGVNMSYAVENQLVVVSCLEDRDETIRRRTLDLLYRMTNSQNVVTIVGCFLVQLRSKCERYWSAELISKISLLCEKFAPSALWYFETVLELMMVAPDLLKEDLLFSTVHVLKENIGDASFRQSVLTQISDLLKRTITLPEMVVKMVSWIYANFPIVESIAHGTSVDGINWSPNAQASNDEVTKEKDHVHNCTSDDMAQKADADSSPKEDPSDTIAVDSCNEDDATQVVDSTPESPVAATTYYEDDKTPHNSPRDVKGSSRHYDKAKPDLNTYIDILLQFLLRYRQSSSTTCWVLGCMRILIIANNYVVPPTVESILSQLEGSNCTDVTQRCKEIRTLCRLQPKLQLSCDSQNYSLGFLEDYVQQRLLAGARAYNRPSVPVPSAPEPENMTPVPELRFEPYATKPTQMSEYKETLTVEDLANEEIMCADVPRTWGPSGYVDKGSVEEVADTPEDSAATINDVVPVDTHQFDSSTIQHSIDLSILSGGLRAPRVSEPQGYVWRKPEPPAPTRQHVEMARALFQGIGSPDGNGSGATSK